MDMIQTEVGVRPLASWPFPKSHIPADDPLAALVGLLTNHTKPGSFAQVDWSACKFDFSQPASNAKPALAGLTRIAPLERYVGAGFSD